MLTHSQAQRMLARGFTLIELMIVLVILGIVMMVALPSMRTMLLNAQLRTAAESMVAGMNVARQEAIRRNEAVRFQTVSNLTSGCALSTTGTSWVVSLADPAGSCATAPIRLDDTAPANPAIIQKKDGAEGSAGATVTANGSLLIFNGVGRVNAASTMTSIDIAHATEACEHASTPGPVRCMRVIVSSGGTIKMCDPKVTATTDPRRCAA